MSTKSVTTNPQSSRSDNWSTGSTTGPSVMRRDDPHLARIIGSMGAAAVIFGGAVLWLNLAGKTRAVGVGWSGFITAVGLCGLLFHATFDWDLQFRRLYMVLAYALQTIGAFLMVVKYPLQVGDQFGSGVLLVLLGLFFLLAFLRNEEDPWLRDLAHSELGSLGGSMALVGLFGGTISVNFLVPFGEVLAVLGLVYLVAMIVSRGIGDDRAYLAGLVLGGVGGLIFLVATGRTLMTTPSVEYLVPSGAVLILLGLIYAATSFALCSDYSLPVLTRRELGTFFFSPIAYFVLVACIIAQGWSYFMGVLHLLPVGPDEEPALEPIVLPFVFQLVPVLILICAVPVLTMRSFSEERRTGTLEVLLTAPVTEFSVVMSKFLAALLLFILTWLPLGLYLVYMRIETGQVFDYRPLLSFFILLVFSGAAFISMGVFFSSLTRNQMISGLFTLLGMITFTGLYLIQGLVARRVSGSNAWAAVLKHVSYLDAWLDTLQGALQPTYLIFFGSMAVLWLFLTVKVLEARKWAA